MYGGRVFGKRHACPVPRGSIASASTCTGSIADERL